MVGNYYNNKVAIKIYLSQENTHVIYKTSQKYQTSNFLIDMHYSTRLEYVHFDLFFLLFSTF